jgi:hypothetical protein
MQTYSVTSSRSKSASRAVIGSIVLFMLIGFAVGFGALVYRNWYLFS